MTLGDVNVAYVFSLRWGDAILILILDGKTSFNHALAHLRGGFLESWVVCSGVFASYIIFSGINETGKTEL